MSESPATTFRIRAEKAERERDEALEALRALYDASPTSCEDRALNEAQKRAEQILNR